MAELAEAKGLPKDFLRQLGLRDAKLHGRPAVVIPYLDEGGSEAATRYRLALTGDQRFKWRKGSAVMPYGLQRLSQARRAGWVLVVEGESDCWTAWYHEAEDFHRRHFELYPGVRQWHEGVWKALKGESTLVVRTVTGRWRRVDYFYDAVNTPVQGTGADGLKLALALLWERRHECPDTHPILAVHDEIVVEAPEDKAETAREWLVRAMTDAMQPLIHPVPVEVEASITKTWETS